MVGLIDFATSDLPVCSVDEPDGWIGGLVDSLFDTSSLRCQIFRTPMINLRLPQFVLLSAIKILLTCQTARVRTWNGNEMK